jgi:CelD/BcsL family acetyltransferase involved in cellulose biosynthesis
VKVDVRRATDTDRVRWNLFVDAYGQPPTNRWEWSEILTSVYGAKTTFLLAESDGEPVGVLPLYLVGSRAGEELVYSLRHGFLTATPAAASELLAEAERLFPTTEISTFLITSGYDSQETPLTPITRTTLTLDVHSSEEEQWSRLGKKTRNMIRKGQTAGLEVVRSMDHLPRFCDLYERHMVKLGVGVHDRAFFSSIASRFGNGAELVSVLHQGRVIGCTLVLLGTGSAIYPYQAVDRAHIGLAPNQVMIWEVLRICRERGIGLLDMGESSHGSATYTFKHNFGGRDTTVHYYERTNDRSGHITANRAARRIADRLVSNVRRRGPYALRLQEQRSVKRHSRLV